MGDISLSIRYYVAKQISKCANIETLLEMIDLGENHVPKSLQLCDTFFTQFVLYSNVGVSSHVNKHKDEKDVIASIITLWDVSSGGKTLYYSGKLVSTPNNIIYEVEFKYGQIQIDWFNNVVHNVEPWRGTRLTLVFNLKGDIVEHFKEFGSKYYNEYENSNV